MNKFSNNLNKIKFFNSHLKSLFIHDQNENKPKQTPKCNYSKVNPTSLLNPRIVSISQIACKILDLDHNQVCEDPETSLYLSGNKVLEGSIPISHCYCGYQFGVFAGQLGDGRAITLGDTYNSSQEIVELQLKGSGKTPYSRFADGRAVLRSTIREYLCSEHLYTLGIPTTRALGMIVSDSKTMRDLLYDNNPIMEKCAVVMRLANSFWRFGSFEIFKSHDMRSGSSGPSHGLESEMLPKMINYLLSYHFPNIHKKYNIKDLNINLIPVDCMKELFTVILSRTAFLAATWQSFGFCHGVLNTDNMSILGVTIDYGPFGFMEYFDKDFICNHSDKNGRYSYNNQPNICLWNMEKLAEAWNFLIPSEQTFIIIKEKFLKIYNDCYYNIMRFKLGLFFKCEKHEDKALIDDLFILLNDFGFDYTTFMRNISFIIMDETFKDGDNIVAIDQAFIDKVLPYSMNKDYLDEKLKPKMNPSVLIKLMEMSKDNPNMLYYYGLDPENIKSEYDKMIRYNQSKTNKNTNEEFESSKKSSLISWITKYKLRLSREAQYFDYLKKGNDPDEFFNLRENFLKTNDINTIQPFSEFSFKDIYSIIYEKFNASNINFLENFKSARVLQMNNLNPKFILRNHLAQDVISSAEEDNFTEVNKLLSILTNPFDEHTQFDEEKLFQTSIEKAFSVCVSCSS